MAELADAQDLGSCGDSVWVQVPLPAPRRSKLRCTASTGTAERLCLLTFVPLRLFFLSKPDPLCWAPVLFFMGFGLFRRLFLRSKKGRHPLRYIRSSFQTRSRRLRVCALGFNVRACGKKRRPFSPSPTAARFAGLAVVRRREAGIESIVTDKRC